jgi:hypothetical protein
MADIVPPRGSWSVQIYCSNCGDHIMIGYEDEVECRNCGGKNHRDNNIWMEQARLLRRKHYEKVAYEQELTDYINGNQQD